MTVLGHFYQHLKQWKEALASSKETGQTMVVCDDTHYHLEEALYFEGAVRFCYDSLGMMLHNRAIRQQCQVFFQWSLAHEEELKKILSETYTAEGRGQEKYQAYSLPTDDLTIESILDLGRVVAEYRLNIYQDLRGSLQTKNRILVNHFIAHIMDEIKFLKKEKEMIGVEETLYSLS